MKTKKKLLFTYSDFFVRVSGPFRWWLSKISLFFLFSSKQIWQFTIPLGLCSAIHSARSRSWIFLTSNPLELWRTIYVHFSSNIDIQHPNLVTCSFLLLHPHSLCPGGGQVYGSVALPLFLEVPRAKFFRLLYSQHP